MPMIYWEQSNRRLTMPNWHNVLNELQQMDSPFDVLRRKYIKELHDYTKRNVICYYSGWLQKSLLKKLLQ
jgi:hypothetical protein